jgi:GNAT superfamily N-acetyltransferase
VNTALTLRTARPEDASRLHALHSSSVRTLCVEHYPEDVIEGWLLNRSPSGFLEPIARKAIFVAEVQSNIVGFGEAVPGVVVAVYVDPVMTRQGIGRAILERAIALACHDAGPIVVESTLNACEFYRRHGFREVGRTTVKRNNVEVGVVSMRRDMT